MTQQAFERLWTQKELQSKETRFRELFNRMNSGVAVYLAKDDGADFIIQDINEAGRRITRTNTEIIGRSIRDVFPGVEESGLFGILQRVWKTGRPETHPITLYQDDRLTFWSVNQVYKLPTEELVAVFEDVTDLRTTEEELKERDTRYLKLSAHVPGMIYQFMMRPDGSFCVPFATEAIRDLFGCSPEDVRESHDPILKVVLPEDLDSLEASIGSSAENMTIWLWEFRVRIPGRPARWLQGHSTPEKQVDGSIVWHGFLTDITERKRAEEQINTDRANLSIALEIAELGLWEYDLANDLFIFNDQFYSLFRTTVEEAGGYTMASGEYARRFVHPDDFDMVRDEILKAAETTDPHYNRQFDHRILHADGTPGHISVRFFIIKDFHGRTIKTFGVNQDITERTRALEALRESEEKYRQIAENIADVVWVAELDLKTLYVSPSVEKMVGDPPAAHVVRTMEEKFPPDSLKRIRAVMREEFAKENDPGKDLQRTRLVEVEHYRADGTRIWVSMNLSFIRDDEGKAVGLLGVSRDITDRKRAEEDSLRNEARLESLLRISHYKAKSTQDLLDHALEEAIQLTGSRLGYIYLYDESKRQFQLSTWSKEAMEECPIHEPDTLYELDRSGIWGEAVRQVRPIIVNDFQAHHPRKKGLPKDLVHLEKFLTVPVLVNGRIVAVAGVANKLTDYDETDARQLTLLLNSVWRITEQKQSELALLRAEEKYRNIFENAQEGIFQTTPEGRYLTANRSLASILGYDSPESLIASVTDIGRQMFADPEEQERLIALIREREGSISGYETRFMRKDGKYIWVSLSGRLITDADGRIRLFEGILHDITSRRARLDQVRKALSATVHAIAVTVEARDPYTAGHQRRVSDLSRAIATEMGMLPDQIDGLRLAGLIHDLGKISVPAEILSKPSQLTALEFQMIQIHPQAGFNILKDVEFPWPIARMVLEHHERIDGSGYPNGLKGEGMLIESRILAVADVVESMASHRPYRPAIGIEPALAEIARHRGTLYDPAAVDACLEIFRKEFQLKT